MPPGLLARGFSAAGLVTYRQGRPHFAELMLTKARSIWQSPGVCGKGGKPPCKPFLQTGLKAISFQSDAGVAQW